MSDGLKAFLIMVAICAGCAVALYVIITAYLCYIRPSEWRQHWKWPGDRYD